MTFFPLGISRCTVVRRAVSSARYLLVIVLAQMAELTVQPVESCLSLCVNDGCPIISYPLNVETSNRACTLHRPGTTNIYKVGPLWAQHF